MLGRIRHARMSFKTGIGLLALGLACGGLFACTNMRADDGALPARWAAGLDCENAAPFQAHQYDRDFYVIRQSKCTNYEAPFLFLFIGEERALLMDTGAVPDADLYGTVMQILEERTSGLGIPAVPLVVAHNQSHGDHTSTDAQFANALGVETVAGLSEDHVRDFWGFSDWPDDVPMFDLGNRAFDVIAIPGHHGTSIALYDRRTQVLLTGDSVYPGQYVARSRRAEGTS